MYRILMVASELWPLAKVGGLADALGGLSRAVGELGHDVLCALPGYRAAVRAIPAGTRRREVTELAFPLGEQQIVAELECLEHETFPAPILLVRHPCFEREGIYDDPATGHGYRDNARRWALFSRALYEWLRSSPWRPDVVHGHDQQAAPLIGLLRWRLDESSRRPALVFTIHNLGYQGLVPPGWIGEAGLPWELFYPAGPLEYHGQVNLMKIGIRAADRLTTVSPRYAEEICSSPEFGLGLEGDLRARRTHLRGILNGIDAQLWDPSHDPYLTVHYDADSLSNKARNKVALKRALGLRHREPAGPLLVWIGRLVPQKGPELFLEALPWLLDRGAQSVVLGSGQREYERRLAGLVEQHPGDVVFRREMDEGLAHRIEAGGDMSLMPSRYEPCGLNQMYSLRYGTVPVVRAVGGLADTVIDIDEEPERGNGFVFRLFQDIEFRKTVYRAWRLWKQRREWREVVRRGMKAEFSWMRAARSYLEVYTEAIAERDSSDPRGGLLT